MNTRKEIRENLCVPFSVLLFVPSHVSLLPPLGFTPVSFRFPFHYVHDGLVKLSPELSFGCLQQN
jgi:hypothetical protein